MQARAETAVGLDVGGTRIRAACITAIGQMHGRVIEPVSTDRDGFLAQVLSLIASVRGDTTRAVGIGIPGRVAGSTGAIHSAGYLDIAGLDLARRVTEATGLPCHLENDATMALMAEAHDSTGLVAMITIGTGVGGGLLRDGRPFHGSDFAGQFGHIVVAADGPLCNCGQRGCVETLCAGPALGALIERAGFAQGATASDILAASDGGSAAARQLVTDWAGPMRRALQTLVAVVDPAQIFLGGGLGREMARALAHVPGGGDWFDRPVAAARLGDDAGVIGAGLAGLAFELPA